MDITRDDLGMVLHTAARKCMDSTQSVAAWNLISVLPPKVWILYLDTVWEAIKDKPEEVTKVVKEVSCNFVELSEDAKLKKGDNVYYDWRDEFKKSNGYAYAYALEAVFKLFADDDWEGYCYWLEGNE